MPDFQKEKLLVLEFFNAIDNADENNLVEIISKYTSKNFNMKCTHPFNELKGADKIAKYLWSPIKKSFKPCLLYTSPSPRDGLLSRMPSSA